MSELPDLPPDAAVEPPPDLTHFWPSLLRAVGTEPRDLGSFRGASGVEHGFVAAGVDEAGKRLVVISKEGRASSAALAQADLQAAMQGKDLQVVVARPVVVDLSAMAKPLEAAIGSSVITSRDLEVINKAQQDGEPDPQKFVEAFGPVAEQVRKAISVGHIDFVQGVIQAMEQLARIRWAKPDDPDAALVDFSDLFKTSLDPEDGELGVCPIPITEFSGDELETINSGSDADAIEAVLREREVYQYFFPPADRTALELFQRGFGGVEDVMAAVAIAPEIGHPFGEPEVTPPGTKLDELVSTLQDKKLLVEGEVTGIDLAALGDEAKGTLRFSPRESFIVKLVNRFEVKVNLKSLFKVG